MHVLLNSFELPLKQPVAVFALLLLVMLAAPLVLHRFRIPGIVGLILAGVVLGPHGLGVLEKNAAINLFGTVGLLYIMFLAGLDLELNDFLRNRHRSGWFGLLTFTVPFALGYLICRHLLGLEQVASLLTASMFSTHTLISYPIVSRLGLSKNEAVTIAVGGTIFTDTLVLILLAVFTRMSNGSVDLAYWAQFSLSLLAFSAIVLWGFPLVARYFFKLINDQTSHYIFTLAMVFLAALLSEWAGVEPIIGAFLAGLALNRLIPHASVLMNRIEFVGNALFIPIFLISVGMIIDLDVLTKGPQAIIVAGVLSATALVSKWLAAWFTQRILRLSSLDRNLIFGLSSSHAAATLAVILVGFNLGILDENVLNGTIVLILITCLVSSFATENAARKIVLSQKQQAEEHPAVEQRVMVPLSNPNTIQPLMDLALVIQQESCRWPIYPISVITQDEEDTAGLINSKKLLDQAAGFAAAANRRAEGHTFVDVNIANGLLHAAHELDATEIIIGWHGEKKAADLIFGHILDTLISKTQLMVLVNRLLQPVNTIKRILVAVPENAAYETGFGRWLEITARLSRQTSSKLLFYCDTITYKEILMYLRKRKLSVNIDHQEFTDWQDFLILSRNIKYNDLFMVINGRKGSISHSRDLDRIPDSISKYLNQTNFILIYPEQYPVEDVE